MRKNKKILVLVISFILMYAFIGCRGQAPTDPGQTDDETTGKKYKIGLSMNTLNNPFFVDAKNGVQKAADENNVELVITDAQNNAATQVTDVENLIAQNLDAIIIDPADSDAITAAVEAANAANIPVITMDRESRGGEVVAHIGFDAIKSGNIAGSYIAEQVKDIADAKIVEIQGIMGTNVAQDRSKGFNEIMERENLNVIARQAADFDRAKAMTVMENILQANPDIDAVYASNDEMALGALEAIKAAGRLDDIILIGCDAIDPALDSIRAGELDATIAEPPFFLGKAALETTLAHLNGESVEKSVILENQLVTADNVDTIKTKE